MTVPQNEGSPPLYFLVGWFWVRIFGRRRRGRCARSRPLAGIATVPVAYFLARELRLSRRIAPARGAARRGEPDARLVLAGGAAVRTVRVRSARSRSSSVSARINDDRTSNFVWWGVAAAAAVCTHYFAVLMVLARSSVWLAIVYRDAAAQGRERLHPARRRRAPAAGARAGDQQGQKQVVDQRLPDLAATRRSRPRRLARPRAAVRPVVAARRGADHRGRGRARRACSATGTSASTAVIMFVLGSAGIRAGARRERTWAATTSSAATSSCRSSRSR